MAAVSTGVDRIDRTVTGGYLVQFSDSNSIEFATVAEIAAYAEPDDVPLLLHKAAMAYWLTRNPSGQNDNVVEGKVFTYDPTQNDSVIGVS